jgi:hypothetical protein
MSTDVGDVDTAVAALYRLPLAEFVAARDELARRLRTAGDRQAARRVAGLRRPSTSAWAANQLAHAAPHALTELLDAGATLQQAQQDALAGQAGAARALRTATAQQRAAIARLVQRAETLLVRAGHAASEATLSRLAATVQAAATGDRAARAALAEGRLAGDLDPAGFGLMTEPSVPEPAAIDEPAPRTRPPAATTELAAERRAQARQAAMRALDRTGRAADHARGALEGVETTAAEQQQAAVVARQRAEELARAAQELAEQAARAASVASEAQQRADAAEQDAQDLAERVELAREAASAAEAAHSAAKAVLDELEEPG